MFLRPHSFNSFLRVTVFLLRLFVQNKSLPSLQFDLIFLPNFFTYRFILFPLKQWLFQTTKIAIFSPNQQKIWGYLLKFSLWKTNPTQLTVGARPQFSFLQIKTLVSLLLEFSSFFIKRGLLFYFILACAQNSQKE